MAPIREDGLTAVQYAPSAQSNGAPPRIR